MLHKYIYNFKSNALPASRQSVLVLALVFLAAIVQAQTTGCIVKGGPDTGSFSGGVLIGLTSKINYATSEQRILIDEKSGILESAWKDRTGVTQSTTSLTKTATDGWGNAGAVSDSILDTLQNGWIQYKINSLSAVLAFGFSSNNVDAHYNSINYAVMINAGQLYIYNLGQLVGNFGTVSLNDTIRITRIGNILFYTKNNQLFFNRELDAKVPLMADVALYTQGVVFDMKSSFAEPTSSNIFIDDVITQVGQRDTTATIFDRFGNTYTYNQVKRSGNNERDAGQGTCTANYFNLDFVGDGFETNPDPNEQNMRDLLCQIFTDLSALIEPSQCNGNTPTVNIKVIAVPIGTPSNALGAATPYYTIPSSLTNTGIIDGDVWKAINSGVNDPTLYDGELQVRFTPPNATWNFNTASTNFPGQYDAYSVYLHEAIHLLGFTTLIGANGQSVAPGFSHHYSRYDAHLNSDINGAFINWNNCYNAVFNVPVSNITSGCPHITFNGSNAGTQPVFAPSPNYLQGTSLSHFDDNCPSTSAHNYVMNASLGINTFHRVPTAEEVNTLQDLGYSTTGIFGVTPTVPTTGLPSGGEVVAGVDDGFANECGINNDLSVCANDATITVQPLANDIGASTFDCLVNVSSFGSVTVNNNTSFTFDPNGQAGIATFTYIPVGPAPNFKRGNITSIHIIVSACGTTCATPVNCNQVCNPDFTIPLTCNDINSPFWAGCVSGWLSSHGSPQITNSTATYTNPDFNTSPEFALMAAGFTGDGGEGMITNVNIEPNKSYTFSYQRKIYPGFAPIDNIHVRLLNSGSLGSSTIPTVIESPVPDIPIVSLEILHETNITSYTAQQVTVCFTTPNAGQSYDWLWIYPDQNTNSPISTVLVDWVELMEDNFSAGVDQSITCGDVTVGLTPLCGVRNVTDQWTWGSNQSNDDQLFFTANNQNQLTQSTTFTLTRTIPANPGGLAHSCSTSDNVLVTVNQSLQLTTNTTSATCGMNNGTADVTVAGGVEPYTFEWKDVNNTIFITQSITGIAAGTYTVTVADANGCSSITTATVNTIPPETTFNYSEGTYCKNGTNPVPTFVGTGVAGVFSATPAGLVFTNTATGEINLSASAAGTYTVTNSIEETDDCPSSSATASVTITATPVGNATPSSQTICSGATTSISLTSTVPGTTYSWTVVQSGVAGASTGSGASIVQTLTATGTSAGTVTYSIVPTGPAPTFCVGLPLIITITVTPIPVMTSASNITVCSGVPVNHTLTSTMPATYSWKAAANNNVSGESTTDQSANPINDILTNTSAANQTVSYTVTPTAGACTGNLQTLSVTVRRLPVMTSNFSATICSGNTVNIPLSSNVPSSYTWIASDNPNTTGESTIQQTGGPLNNTLINTTLLAQTVSYTVTPTSNAGNCAGQSQTVTVTVNPLPAMTSTNSATICSGTTLAIGLTSDIAAAYQWKAASNASVTGESTANQNGSTINNTLTNTSTVSQTVNYTVTPTSTGGGCQGNSQTVAVEVLPAPTMTSAANITVCSGVPVNHTLTSTIPATYSWVAAPNNNVSGESTTAQTANPISDVLINTSAANQNVSYTVTPTSTAGACTGNLQTVSVTVRRLPVMNITTTATICSGSAVNIPLSSNVPSSYTWIASDNANTTGESATPQTGGPLYDIITNTTSIAQTVSYTVTPTSNPNIGSCAGQPQTVTVTVNPIPTMTNPGTATVCSGIPLNIVLASDIPATYSWKATNNPNTGGESTTAQSGSPINNTINILSGGVQTVNYTVTPTSTGGGCPGNQQTISVTVNPKPTVTATPANHSICSGTLTNIALSSNITNSTFIWAVVQTGVTGAAAGSGSSIAQSLTATGSVSGTAVYTITPTSPLPAGCSGNSITVTITVKPKPVIAATPSSQSICSGSATSIALTNSLGGAAFSWTPTTITGVSGAAAGNGPNISQGLIATSQTTAGTVEYTATSSFGGCSGSTIVYVTVNPAPNVTISPTTQTICSGGITSISLSSTLAGTTFNWTFTGGSISGGSNGSGSLISQTLTNPTPNIVGATYWITATSSLGCSASPVAAGITIAPKLVVTATPSSQTLCTGGTTSIALNSNVSGVSYSWTVVQSGVTGASNGSGSSISQTLFTIGTSAGTAVYTIIPSANGCSGNPVTVTVTVNPVTCTGGLAIDYYVPCMGTTTNALFGNATTVQNKNISVSGTLSVNTNITFSGCNFVMAAGSSIVLNANLTLTNSTRMFSCGDMWNGIQVNSSTRTLTITNNAFIEDALKAVSSTNGGKYNIQGAIFNRNLTAIEVNGGSNHGNIVNSVITSRNIPPIPAPTVAALTGSTLSTNYNKTNLKAPYTNRPGLYGVNATDVTELKVGVDLANRTNTFDAIMCGVNLTRTNATIYNNRFQHLLLGQNFGCLVGTACLYAPGYGIAARGSTTIAYSITVGGLANVYQPNTFFNTYSAVNISNYKTTKVVRNTIDNLSTGSSNVNTTGYGVHGIYISPAINGNITDVIENNIKNCATGIWVNRSGNGRNSLWVFIDHNTVKADASGYCSNGINITDAAGSTSGTPTDKIKIQYNTVQQAYTCITATNVKNSLVIRENPLLEVRNNNSTAGNGIRLQNCANVKIHNNPNITLFPVATDIKNTNIIYKGISVTTSPGSRITCNTILKMGESMVFKGSCASSMLRNNRMTGGNRGLVLRSNGEIGTQGSATVPCDLWWSTASPNDFNAHTFLETTNNANTNSKLYVDNNGAPGGHTGIPTLNGGTVAIANRYHFSPAPAGLNTASGGPFNCAIYIDEEGGRSSGSGFSIDSADLVAFAFDTAQYPVYEQEHRYRHRLYAFGALDESIDSITNPMLQGFYDSTQLAPMGQLQSVDDAFTDNDYTLAAATNNSVSAGNVIETNQQQFNALYLLSQNDSAYVYTQAEKDALYAIAEQCPLAGGDAVWQARVLYCTIENNLIEFDDNCTDGAERMRTAGNTSASPNFIVYPNPNDGSMQLAYLLNTSESGIFSLHDITGKPIVTYALENSTNKLSIDNLQLSSGIYYYSVYVNDKLVKTEKVVIIK